MGEGVDAEFGRFADPNLKLGLLATSVFLRAVTLLVTDGGSSGGSDVLRCLLSLVVVPSPVLRLAASALAAYVGLVRKEGGREGETEGERESEEERERERYSEEGREGGMLQ